MLSREEVLKALEKVFQEEESALTSRIFTCSPEMIPGCRAQRAYLLNLRRKVLGVIQEMEAD